MIHEIANKIAGYFRCSNRGSCGAYAAWLTLALLHHKITRFKVVFGRVHTWVADGSVRPQHVWIELPNGEKIDPTIVQFETDFQKVNLKNPYGKKKKKYTPKEFLKNPDFWNDRTLSWVLGFTKPDTIVEFEYSFERLLEKHK